METDAGDSVTSDSGTDAEMNEDDGSCSDEDSPQTSACGNVDEHAFSVGSFSECELEPD